MKYLFITFSMFLLLACNQKTKSVSYGQSEIDQSIVEEIGKIEKSEEEWEAQLSEMEYYVLRKAGTERAFTGEYWDNKNDGIYNCRACQLPLFSSKTKYKSGTGWPSFWEPLKKEVVTEDTDYLLGYPRTEVLCARCDSHLGHVFKDGPKPTGLRYCMNSVSLSFTED